HNVFSLSPTRKFDLGQYPRGETKTKQFPNVGVVEVYCNIHPEMAATILVLPNRRFARAAGEGGVCICGGARGRWAACWDCRRAIAPVSASVEVRSGGTTEVQLSLEETRVEVSHTNKFGETYREPGKYRP